MPYVVTQSCCSDASCVLACPVNCIHPAPGEPGFAEAEMVYVDAASCVDCGACTTACPVDAIKPHTALTEAELPFIALASSYYESQPHLDRAPLAIVPRVERAVRPEEVRVAIVGAGPAALYAADELLKNPGVVVDVIDRLPTPYGLARAGVAPDHRRTRQVTRLFEAIDRQPGFDYLLNLEVGRDITHEELRRHYHAVLYATGASADRRLGIPGEDLPGSTSATAVVGWYNAHPDHQDAYVDLGGERVVVVGNGNVALDVARILTADPAQLAATDIADLPLAAMRGSAVREVVVLGRRGPAEAAFTMPELIGLAGLEDVDVIVDTGGRPIECEDPKGRLLAELSARPRAEGRRRIVLRFHTAPVRVLGGDFVEGVEVERTRTVERRAVGTGETEVLSASMVLRSVGYRGVPLPGLPFDPASATVPHTAGRVEPGVYVAGWIKRGPSGFLGTNKACAEESVASLLADLDAGLLASPAGDRAAFRALAAERRPGLVDAAGWRAIDAAERAAGAREGRPRVRFTDVAAMVAASRAHDRPTPRRGRRRRAPAAC
ncbi:MAG: FAD-dependent oxidoreductase [Marmoricola sp.]